MKGGKLLKYIDKNMPVPAALEAEHFIPISKFALLEHFEKLTKNGNDKNYKYFFRYLIIWRHQKYRQRLNQLKKCYLPFSPDRDTLRVQKYTKDELTQLQNTIVSEISALMQPANYKQITQNGLNNIFAAESPHGLQLMVDLSEFEELLLFSRGLYTERRQRRIVSTLFFKKESYKVKVFQRLFLLLKLKPKQQRLKEIMAEKSIGKKKATKLLNKYRSTLPERVNDDHIYLKLFKNIPQADLKMLFPNTRVQLKPLDKLKLSITAGGGSVGSIFATATKLAAAANPIAAAGTLLGLVGVVFRQVTKFFNQRTKYMMLLAQKLYFHNLASNRGVLTLLVDRAEEEEIKETILLYNFLSHNKVKRQHLSKLKRHIENYFFKRFGARIHFRIDDAFALLEEDGIVKVDAAGNIAVLDTKTACQHLQKQWQRSVTDNDLPDKDDSGEL